MRPTTYIAAFAAVIALSVTAVAVGRNSPETRALKSTAAIACPECGEHPVAAAVYLGKGQFLTAYHCAPDEGAVIGLLIDDLPYIATVSRASSKHHLTLLEVVASDIPLRPARVAPDPKLQLGTRVFERGYPDGIPMVMRGYVSDPAWTQTLTADWPARVMTLDLSAAGGSSGGGVFLERNGNLVGIHIGSNPTRGDVSLAVRLEDVKAFLATENERED